MNRILLLLLFSFLANNIFCQEKADFRPPMDIPLILSGNFGELRSDHFHSGLDFKTQGVSGHKVFAIESGYVSRINIRPGGYGKALYIAHPNGHTSVYGHLLSYNKDIGSYAKSSQYSRKSHSVDIYLKPGELPVEKGELIALSGNTGSSTGPHLHFEIRRTADQKPLNGLLFGFPIVDNIAPKITKLAIYPSEEHAHVQNSFSPVYFQTVNNDNKYTLGLEEPVVVYGKTGFGIEVFDYLNGANNRCGVVSIDLQVEGTRYFYSEINEFSFSESRFINAHIDYAHKTDKGGSVQRLHKLPYNELSIYKLLENNGFIEFKDTLTHNVSITVADSYGNTSTLDFLVKGAGARNMMKANVAQDGTLLRYNAPGDFSEHNIQLSFPAYCFYEDVYFKYARTNGMQGLLSDIFHIHNESTPLHRDFKLSVLSPNIPENQRDKLCLVKIGAENKLSYAGGKYSNGYVTENVRSFGKYAISIDTISPFVRPLDLFSGKDVSEQPGIRFQITDDLSGIDTYNGYIDDQWVLFEYDPKNDLLYHEFDDRVPISKKNRELEIHLTDAKGNKTIYKSVFIR